MGVMPFAEYDDFDDCVAKNSDKDDPAAYCAAIERSVKGDQSDGEHARRPRQFRRARS